MKSLRPPSITSTTPWWLRTFSRLTCRCVCAATGRAKSSLHLRSVGCTYLCSSGTVCLGIPSLERVLRDYSRMSLCLNQDFKNMCPLSPTHSVSLKKRKSYKTYLKWREGGKGQWKKKLYPLMILVPGGYFPILVFCSWASLSLSISAPKQLLFP